MPSEPRPQDHHRVRPDGLFRCCIQTALKEATANPIEGEEIPCLWCSDGVTWRNGAWEATMKGDRG